MNKVDIIYKYDYVKKIKHLFYIIILIVFFIQLFFDSSIINIKSNLFTTLNSYICIFFIFKRKIENIIGASVTVIVFFILISNSFLPMLGTLLEGKSLVYNLKMPETVFGYRLIFNISILAAWSLILKFKFVSNKNNFKTFLAPPRFIWLLFFIGSFSYLANIILGQGVFTKFIEGFKYFTFAPSLLLLDFYKEYRMKNKLFIIHILFYFITCIVISTILNTRFIMVGPISVFILGFFISVFIGQINLKKYFSFKYIPLLMLFISVFILLSMLSKAMLVARDLRDERSFNDQVSETFNVLQNQDLLEGHDIKEEQIVQYRIKKEIWEENYISNTILARFMSIKNDDNCFYRMEKFNTYDNTLIKIATYNRVLALLPDPIINLIGLKIDKKEINSFSIGDLNEMIVRKTYKSFRVGSILTNFIVIFNYYFVFATFILYFLVFFIYSKVFSFLQTRVNTHFLFLLMPTFVITAISFDSIANLLSFMIRGIIQVLILYLVCYYIFIIFSSILNKQNTR